MLPTLGTIMSHGYLTCGFLPIRLALPCIIHVVRGQVSIPNALLAESFADSLNVHEAGIVKDALAVKGEVTTFSPHLQQSLLSMFARYGCRNVPTPKNLMKLILDSARYEFVIKPCAAVNALRSGVPKPAQ